MSAFTDACNKLNKLLAAKVSAGGASDFVVDTIMVPKLRQFLLSKSYLQQGKSPSEQTQYLQEFFHQPEGLKFLVHFRNSSYNSMAGTSQLFYKILSHV